MPDRTICVAPMMERTDRYCRYFLRLISRHAVLYTEMITAAAILNGDRGRLLGFDAREHPVALQVGGSEPRDLAACARIAEAFGYDEVNLNIGCPSGRVRHGRFGACLMAEPDLVARALAAVRAATVLPVTVKTRIGIDDHDSYDHLKGFVATVAAAGCCTFIIHARKAWLSGLSPRENREVPPLDYARVYALKRDFPDLEIVVNGGIRTDEEAAAHLAHVDGAMIGRAAYDDPYMLAKVDRRFYGADAGPPSRHAVVANLLPYVEAALADGAALHHIARHITGLFQGLPGARRWRRYLSENASRPGAGPEVIEEAARLVPAVHGAAA